MKAIILIFSFVFLFMVGFTQAQEEQEKHMQGDHPEHTMTAPGDLKWMDGPASLPAGSKAAVLNGDPKKAGLFTIRVKFPANYKIQPHWHPANEHITVISGSFSMGLGEEYDPDKGEKMPAGSFMVMNAKTAHYAWTTEESVIQLHGMGPWGITYISPDDDPRNK